MKSNSMKMKGNEMNMKGTLMKNKRKSNENENAVYTIVRSAQLLISPTPHPHRVP